MPRPLRIEYPNAWYHVMNRGAGYRDIYSSERHRQIFLEVLKEAIDQFGIEIHAYCLMNNHYHLLIKTPEANLGRAMRHINGVYTQRFNKTQKTDGPLFRGRYKALIVEKETYLLQVSRYIHLNPVAAKITKSLASYPWSSYADYIYKTKKTSWLKVDEVLAMLNATNHSLAYKKFVAAGVDRETQSFYEKRNMPIVLGNPAFKEKILELVEPQQIQSSQPDYNRTKNFPSMDAVASACVAYLKVEKDTLLKRYRKNNEARKVAIYGSRVWARERLSVIAEYYHCSSHSSVTNAVKDITERLGNDAKFTNVIKKIQQRLML